MIALITDQKKNKWSPPRRPPCSQDLTTKNITTTEKKNYITLFIYGSWGAEGFSFDLDPELTTSSQRVTVAITRHTQLTTGSRHTSVGADSSKERREEVAATKVNPFYPCDTN